MERTEFLIQLEDVYKDIHAIKIDINDSFKTSLDKFYEVMRKHGICQGTWVGNGRQCNTPEWCMCFEVFKAHKILSLDIWLMLNEPPEDLLAYGEKPKK